MRFFRKNLRLGKKFLIEINTILNGGESIISGKGREIKGERKMQQNFNKAYKVRLDGFDFILVDTKISDNIRFISSKNFDRLPKAKREEILMKIMKGSYSIGKETSYEEVNKKYPKELEKILTWEMAPGDVYDSSGELTNILQI